ncbi:hypothetical protein ACHAO8_003553 [Botrytis cinerea]
MLSCFEHLPRHGNTADDSQYGLLVVIKTKDELEAYGLIPFRQAMKADTDAVMVAHISLPLLDNTFDVVIDDSPASLSPDATRILREEMKCYGLIVSDCLKMGETRATYGTEKELVMMLNVSATDMITNTNTQTSHIWPRADFIMIFHTLKAQLDVIEAVIMAVKSDVIITTEVIPIVSNAAGHIRHASKGEGAESSGDRTVLSPLLAAYEAQALKHYCRSVIYQQTYKKYSLQPSHKEMDKYAEADVIIPLNGNAIFSPHQK